MTKEEAIKLIDDRMCFGRGKWSEHHKPEIDIYWQAGEMAIKALEAEPHWIPVTERLPETGQDVELCCGYKNYRGEIARYICIAYHVNRYEMKYSADWDEGCDEYREEDDEYYVLEGWYERIHNWDTYGAVKIYDLALAWRELPKLPEPYKGVTE